MSLWVKQDTCELSQPLGLLPRHNQRFTLCQALGSRHDADRSPHVDDRAKPRINLEGLLEDVASGQSITGCTGLYTGKDSTLWH